MRTPVTVSLLALVIGTAVTGCGLLDASTTPGPPTPLAVPVNAPPAGPAQLKIVGLVGGTTLVNLTTTDVTPRDSREISGLEGDRALVGIDYRVQDGKLYGVGDAGGVYTLEDTGVASKVKQLSVELDGENFGVDFNPVANALRIISDTGQNLRQPFADTAAPTANDKALTNPAAAPATGTVPAEGAASAGYTNNDEDKNTATALFVLDTKADRVSIQSPANSGTFAPMGGLGVDAGPAAGFDIYNPGPTNRSTGPMALATLQVNGAWGLYQVDLLTGRAERLGELADKVTDIALPLDQN